MHLAWHWLSCCVQSRLRTTRKQMWTSHNRLRVVFKISYHLQRQKRVWTYLWPQFVQRWMLITNYQRYLCFCHMSSWRHQSLGRHHNQKTNDGLYRSHYWLNYSYNLYSVFCASPVLIEAGDRRSWPSTARHHRLCSHGSSSAYRHQQVWEPPIAQNKTVVAYLLNCSELTAGRTTALPQQSVSVWNSEHPLRWN